MPKTAWSPGKLDHLAVTSCTQQRRNAG